jgi:predicted site-specific integrase-resolvase
MITQTQSQLLPIAEAVELVTGRKFHPVTVLRWRREGRLPGCRRVGREWLCSIESVHRMIEKDSEARTKAVS